MQVCASTNHLVAEPIDFGWGAAVNDGLRDGQRLVQIAQRLKLPVLALDSDVELMHRTQK
jgi:acetyl-CoA carboxylase alpha subunit